ncbi:hypothetical protein [Flavobacterium luteolum]|uniref:hypothetical protein n=1 Tax=Flavobacterium luteolum TaxID=3003259 RepID=UPI00248DCE00|nr:hypothetical protein [Flavobacterium luteolum]
MRNLFTILLIPFIISCNQTGTNNINDKPVHLLAKKDSIVENTSFSTRNLEAHTNIIATWRIYQDVGRDGEKCDSISINNGTCTDRNTEMIRTITFETNGNYTLESGFKTNHISNDRGTWKIEGTKYGIDLLLLESHTTKLTTGPSAPNMITTYIIQLVNSNHLVLIDAGLFNTMYFKPNDKLINRDKNQ